MDEKNLAEIRRKKLLANAEARLRFIKEGIPWRNTENVDTEASQPDDNLKKDTNIRDPSLTQDNSELTGKCIGSESLSASNPDYEFSNHVIMPAHERLHSADCKYKHMNASSGNDNAMSSKTFIREEGGIASNLVTEETNCKNENKSDVQPADGNVGKSLNPLLNSDDIEIDLKDTEMKMNDSKVNSNDTDETEVKSDDPEVKSNDTEVKSNALEKTSDTEVNSNNPNDKTNETEVKSNDKELEMKDFNVISEDIEVISNVPPSRRIDRRGLIPDELVRNIKALLCESSNEREEQKRRTREMNVNIWTSLFIMLCLGVITRISYAVGLSWLFKGVMLVPFFTVAVPRLIPMILNPPPPTGPLVQFLLMVGVKLKLLKQLFTVVAVMRMFLKLFSVFLIAFVFTHQVVESFFT